MPGLYSLGRVKTAVPPNPESIYYAICQIRTTLDSLDEGSRPYISSGLLPCKTTRDDARAWMFTALLLAHIAEIDSMTLDALANDIWKGRQDALDLF